MEVIDKVCGAIMILIVLFMVVMVRPYLRSIRIRRKTVRLPIMNESEKMLQLNQWIAPGGFTFDRRQNIFSSRVNALVYDGEGSANRIVDREVIHFEWKGRAWKIELVKGQCYLYTKAELRVYYKELADSDSTYQFVDEEDAPRIQFALWQQDKKLFSLKGYHWWLSGFTVGSFAKPADLKMQVEIAFESKGLRNAFLAGLAQAGFVAEEIATAHKSVSFLFDSPRSKPRPFKPVKQLRQAQNKWYCRRYQRATRDFSGSYDKIAVFKQKEPRLFAMLVEGEQGRVFFRERLDEQI